MEKGYARKVTLYEDANGNRFDSLSQVRLFKTKEQAKQSGPCEIVEVIRPDKKPIKPSRRNQLWMRGDSS